MLRPTYLLSRIQTINSLALALGLDAELVTRSLERHPRAWRSFTKAKKDGSLRELTEWSEPTVTVLRRIHSRILARVQYPIYLHGSLKGRSPRTHVQSHVGARTFIALDVKKFFDVVTEEHVRDVWCRFFRFGQSVVEVLTVLTTKGGILAQGSPTSPALANLVFWENEHRLVRKLHEQGCTYTRYVDDIVVSSRRRLAQEEIDSVIGTVRWMLGQYGMQAKNRKTDVTFAGKPMLTTGLVAGSAGVTMTKKDRARIRAAVHAASLRASGCTPKEEVPCLDSIERTLGRVAHLEQFHPLEADRLRGRLKQLGLQA